MSDGAGDRIRLARPWTGDEELDAVRRVLDSGWLTQGPEVEALEREFAGVAGTRHAVAVNSGTSALQLALAALDLSPGDEVLVPDFTFPATANAVLLDRLRPVIVDIDPATFNIDPAAAATAVGPRTRAIMPVHQFGLMADMDALYDLALDRDLAVIEDAACAIGAESPAGRSGGVSLAGCFSLHPRKTVTSGEGGIVVTDDDDIAARVRRLRNHGIERGPDGVTFVEPGWNLRLSDLLGALGRVQLGRLAEGLALRTALARRYDEGLADLDGLTTPAVPDGHVHTYQTYAALLDERIDRAALMKQLADQGIETSIGAHALHRLPYLADHLGGRTFDGSARAADCALCLPLHPGMDEGEVDRVVEALRSAI